MAHSANAMQPRRGANAPRERVENAPIVPGDPYGAARIRRGVSFLVVGKAATAVAGIGTFVLLVRVLPVEQFAAYSILFALVELVEAITGVGLSQILSRYVPELFVERRKHVLRMLVAAALALRFGILAVFLAAVYALAPTIAPLIGLADWEWAVRAYLAVVLVRVAATTLFGILESMLHQAIAQLGFSLVAVLRFVLLAVAASQGSLDLETVIVIELVTDIAGFGVMSIGTIRAIRRDAIGDDGRDEGWVRANARRMTEFGVKGYLQHLLILPYGGSTNRILVGASLSSGDVALFGFAQSVADLMERFLPVKLLAGVIRPVLTARYVRDRRFSDLEMAANLILKINATLVCLAAVVIYSGGKPMLAQATGGKYSDGGVGILLLMCALVLMYSVRFMLDHVCHAVEKNGPLMWSNAVITSSILPGIAMLPSLGVYALPLANVVGLVIGSWVLIRRLGAAGFHYRQDIAGLAGLLIATGIGMLIAEASRWAGIGWLPTVIAGAVAFVVGFLVLRPITPSERQLLMSIVRQRRS